MDLSKLTVFPTTADRPLAAAIKMARLPVKVRPEGRIAIPIHLRATLHLTAGDTSALCDAGNGIRLTALHPRIQHAQDVVACDDTYNRSPADELIAGRREEAAPE